MPVIALALLQAAGVPSADAPPSSPSVTSNVAASHLLQDGELVLFAVELDRLTLTDTLTAYGDPADPLLPVGELARLLDLDLTVLTSQKRIVGTLSEARRSVVIDLNAPIARIGGKTLALAPSDAGLSGADIYIRASVLEQVLPLKIAVDAEALTIRLTATEKLPLQARMERQERQSDLGRSFDRNEPVLRIESRPAFVSPPSFDVAIEGGMESRAGRYPRRFDVRLAGDLLYSNFQGYVGSDETGEPSTVRMLLERRSAAGKLLGPIGATRVSIGDVFTPDLPIGPRSSGGRGVSFTTAPLEQASIFNSIDLRGELPIGFDAELYVNDVLRSGQRTPVQGRYEFLAVPLVQGVNVIRIVTYGTRGERSEMVRVINVGGGQLPKGKTTLEFGLVQQDKAVIDPRPLGERELILTEVGAPRLVGSVAYGLTSTITMIGGVAAYTSASKRSRNLATIGARTSVAGVAVQFDAAGDQAGGRGLTLGLAGQPLGISTLFRHSEYKGGFIDETSSITDFLRPPTRKSALTTDLSLPKISGVSIPVSARVVRDAFPDGGVNWVASARGSAPIGQTLVSTGVDFERLSRPGVDLQQRLTGNLSASTFANFKWQLRGSLDYELLPTSRLRALALTADRAVSDRLSLRLGVGQSLARPRHTFLQAGAIMRFRIGDLALNGDYSPQRNDLRLGFRFAFGALFDSWRGRYVMTPPGAAAGANAILQSFVDNDGDGRLSAGDEPTAKVKVEGGAKQVITDRRGQGLITGLGSGPSGQLRVDISDVDTLFVGTPPAKVEFTPRPGQVLKIPYPLVPVGEVYARFILRRTEGAVGLSAVRVRLLRDGADPIVGMTEFDGSVVFSEVPIATYRLELDPEQSKRLGMRLKGPIAVVVSPEGGKEIEAEVVFDQSTVVSPVQSVPDGSSGVAP